VRWRASGSRRSRMPTRPTREQVRQFTGFNALEFVSANASPNAEFKRVSSGVAVIPVCLLCVVIP